VADIEVLNFADADEWDRWLAEQDTTRTAVWLKIPKKSAGLAGMTAAEAGDVAIAHGWIDGHRRGLDGTHFLSATRRVGRAAAPGLGSTSSGSRRWRRPGECGRVAGPQVAAAKADGRWAAAYTSHRTAVVPDDLTAAPAADDRARAAFEALGRSERYAICLSLLKARTPDARARALRRALDSLVPPAP
jgi:uncharacterized protein YdeI (YjbR/CyaY-like superfamily)